MRHVHFDSMNAPQAELAVRLRDDLIAGVSLGDRDLMPGEVATLPYGLAIRLVRNGKATVVTDEPLEQDKELDEELAEDLDESDGEEDPPAVREEIETPESGRRPRRRRTRG